MIGSLGVCSEMGSLGRCNFGCVSGDSVNKRGSCSIRSPITMRGTRVGSPIRRGWRSVSRRGCSCRSSGVVCSEVCGLSGSDFWSVSDGLRSAVGRRRVRITWITVLCAGHTDSNEAEEHDLEEDVQTSVASYTHTVHVPSTGMELQPRNFTAAEY